MNTNETTPAKSYTTETVHLARKDANGRLVQVCGMGRRQRASLFPVDAKVTCRKCLGAHS
jgi:hypothetical protein